MRSFDLEAAKRGEPIQTREGTPVQFIAHVPEAATYKIVALINEDIETFKEDGTHCDGRKTGFDLFMALKKRTVWINLYPESRAAWCYSTQEEADEKAGRGRISSKAYPVEIEE